MGASACAHAEKKFISLTFDLILASPLLDVLIPKLNLHLDCLRLPHDADERPSARMKTHIHSQFYLNLTRQYTCRNQLLLVSGVAQFLDCPSECASCIEIKGKEGKEKQTQTLTQNDEKRLKPVSLNVLSGPYSRARVNQTLPNILGFE